MAMNEWWRGAVIYQVYPRSFFSAERAGVRTGDESVGNLPGITAKIDYLKKLNIDIVWVSPFFQSPMRDYGYDVSDYCAVDPMFGTMGDYTALTDALHKNGIKLMIDQVYNHTSDVHPWFVESRSSRENPKADWYVWKDPTDTGYMPNNWLSVFSGPAWTWDTRRRQYYLHQFLSEQPDLNFNNPAVQGAILDSAKFWLERGVDGFRLDTVTRYVQHPDLPDNPPLPASDGKHPTRNPLWMQEERYNQGRPENLQFLAKLRKLVDEFGGKLLLGELGCHNENELQGLYTAGKEHLHIAYTFSLLNRPICPQSIAGIFQDIAPHIRDGWPCWAFSNHDVVRAASRNPNIGDERRGQYARLLLTVLLALRGTPCIYQGEELGLPEGRLDFDELRDPFGIRMWPDHPSRDGCRVPMPWSSTDEHCGFSASAPPWLPIKREYADLAVDVQERDPGSTLAFFRRLIAWRKTQVALCTGGGMHIERADDAVLHFVREGSAGGNDGSGGSSAAYPSIACYYNFSNEPQELSGARGELISGQVMGAGGAVHTSDTLVLPPLSSAFMQCK